MRSRIIIVAGFITCLLLVATVAREDPAKVYETLGWNAEDYFEDPQLVALCKAIEANDLSTVERLLSAGVDVNARGIANVTPLLWAFPGNHIERFRLLLEHGADPNVQLTQDMPSVGKVVKNKYIIEGDSPIWLAMQTRFDGFLESAIRHGGDVNQVHPRWKEPLIAYAMKWNKFEEVKLLAKHGANLDWKTAEGSSLVMGPVQNGRYAMTLLLLELGADHTIYVPKTNFRLIHFVAREERTRSCRSDADVKYNRKSTWSEHDKKAHQELVDWLKAHGEDYEKAQAEEKLWWEWLEKDEYKEKMRKAYYARLQQERQKKEAVMRDEEVK